MQLFYIIFILLSLFFVIIIMDCLINSFNKKSKKTKNTDYVKKLEEEVDKDILNYYIKIIDFINNSDKKELKIRFSSLSYINIEKSSSSYYRVYLKNESEEYSERNDFEKEDFLTNEFLKIFYKAMEEFKRIEKNKNNIEQKINQFKDRINIIDELSSKTPLKKEVSEFQNIQDNKISEIITEILDKEIFYFKFVSNFRNGLVPQLFFIEEYSEQKAYSKILHYFLDCYLNDNNVTGYINFLNENFHIQLIKYSKEEFIKYLENKKKWDSELDKDYNQKMDKLIHREASIYYLNGKIDKLSNYLLD